MKLIAICLLALPLLAAAKGDKEDKWAEHKAKALEHIEERIQKMQEHKTCISAATTKEAFKACHKNMKEWREGEREERQDRRKERRERREKRGGDEHVGHEQSDE